MADAPAESIQVQPESVTTAASTAPTSNAEGTQAVLSDDEALDRILGPSSKEESEGDARARDERGRFAGKEPQAETSEDTDTAADTSAASLNPELAKAVEALKRDGWSDSDIALLPEARRLEMGNRRAKAQSDQDEFSARKGREAQPEPAQAEQSKPPAIDPSITAAVDEFVAAYGDEARDPLLKVMGSLDSKYQKQIGSLVEAVQIMVQDQIKADAFEARQTLEKEYPQLKDKARHPEVAQAMEMFYNANPQKFGDMGTLMSTACKFVFAEERMAELKKQMDHSREQRKNAVPTAVARKNGASPGKPQDRDDEVLDLLLSGNKEQAKALARN